MIKLGDEVKDMVSGFQGIAVARYQYLQGCNRIGVQPPVDRDGKLPEMATFDEPQMEVIEKEKVVTGVFEHDVVVGGPEKYMPSDRPGG